MAIKSVQDLFINELRDIYYAEKQILKALPKMAKKATHQELRSAFEQHAEQTRDQIERIEQVFEMLDVGKRAKRCEAMEGILEEAREHMEEVQEKSVLDPAMIVCAQKVEHYEIAGYGSLVALANQLGHKDAAKLLEQTLNEEKQTDQKLSQIALGVANQDAQAKGGKAA